MFKKLILLMLVLSGFQVAAMQKPKMMDHSHMPISVPSVVPTPQLSLNLTRDAMSGFNLEILISNYVFVLPPSEMSMMEMMSVGPLSADGLLQGHAHLYINGEKIQRVYGRLLHLPAERFKNGINNISITLNNNGHMHWVVEDKKVIATLTINPDMERFLLHNFASFPHPQ